MKALAQSLHTAARRYCHEQFKHWANRYSVICRAGKDRADDRYHYTTEALNVFPRYNILNAIRVEIERIDPDALVDIDATKELMILAGVAAEDDFTRNPIGQIDADAMADERQSYCDYIRSLRDSELYAVQALPYQRVLSQHESQTLWSRLRDRWKISDGYWFPLSECQLPEVVAFQDHYFYEFNASCKLDEILASHGVSRLWELREFGTEYEQDVSLFDPVYNGAEGYWSSGDLDWIVYVSHESSVTIGGWLLSEIKKHWPDWSQRIWGSQYF